jgi:hypothetical protein
MKANPVISPEDTPTSSLTTLLKAEFSAIDFLQVFKYLNHFLDWEKTPKEGEIYCKCKILHLSTYIRLSDKAINMLTVICV